MPAAVTDGASAPSYPIPQARIVSIEHPCIIKNFHNGFKSLGGEQQLKHVLEHDIGESRDPDIKNGAEPVAGVSLRPYDPFAKKLASTAAQTANVLIKVTLPARTGRKRKRGSDGPFESTSASEHGVANTVTAPNLLCRMRDNPDRYTVNAVGMITDTHRFRTLPDFQKRADDVPIMQQLRDHIMVPNYDRLKGFKLPTEQQPLPPPNFIPPPRPSAPKPTVQDDRPLNTRPWRQRIVNPDGVSDRASDRFTTSTSGPPPQLRDLVVSHTAHTLPSAPPPKLDIPEPDSVVANIISKLSTILSSRPILPRRTYWSKLPGHRDPNIRRTLPHLAYYLDTGPWRYNIVKYGVDPRIDPGLRVYQTVSYSRAAIKVIKDAPNYDNPPFNIRTFDGTQVVDPGEMWGLCDFTQPLISRLVNDSPVRDHYDDKWGWYFNGTIAKILVLVRDMMIQLSNPQRDVVMTDREWEIIAKLPDQVFEQKECFLNEHMMEDWFGERAARHLCQLAEAVGDEAMEPTFCGIRGYEEVVPVRGWQAGDGGVVGAVDGGARV